MKFSQYQEAVLNGMVIKDYADPTLHAAMGLCAESGEVLDLFKKAQYANSNRLNVNRVLEEMGDALWYLTYLAAAFGFSLEEIAQMNYEKLSERHPDRYPALCRHPDRYPAL